jgi:hypothetical protein
MRFPLREVIDGRRLAIEQDAAVRCEIAVRAGADLPDYTVLPPPRSTKNMMVWCHDLAARFRAQIAS